MLTFNEGKVCDAIIHYLEARECAQRTDITWPEDEHHANPVEITWKFGPQLFAIEHTGIEPFEGHVQMDAEAERHFGPISVALNGVLPADVFDLHVPAKAMLHRGKAEIARIQAAIIEWVKHTAPTLPVRRYADYKWPSPPVSLPGVPFALQLFRFETLPEIGGRFQIQHLVTGDRTQAQSRPHSQSLR